MAKSRASEGGLEVRPEYMRKLMRLLKKGGKTYASVDEMRKEYES